MGRCHEENKAGPRVEGDLEVGGEGSCRQSREVWGGFSKEWQAGWGTKRWAEDVPGGGAASAEVPRWRQQVLGGQRPVGLV